MPDWSDLSKIPLATLKLEYEHFWISGSPYRASALKEEIERRERQPARPDNPIAETRQG